MKSVLKKTSSNNITATIKVSNALAYIPTSLNRPLKLRKLSQIQFLEIGGEWFMSSANRFGQGARLTKWENQNRLVGKYIRELRKRMNAIEGKSLTLTVEMVPRKFNDGRIFFPVKVNR